MMLTVIIVIAIIILTPYLMMPLGFLSVSIYSFVTLVSVIRYTGADMRKIIERIREKDNEGALRIIDEKLLEKKQLLDFRDIRFWEKARAPDITVEALEQEYRELVKEKNRYNRQYKRYMYFR